MKNYYDLTKEEYKKFEKEFNTTYVGKQIFNYRFTGWLIGLISYVPVLYTSIKTDLISLYDLIYLFIGSICLLLSVLVHIYYRKELKKYIIEKSTNK